MNSPTPSRLRLPETLEGEFTGLIIGTFGAELEFAEAHLFRQLSRRTVGRLVLADDVQLSTFLANQPPLRRINRSYVAAPVRSPKAHHPKFLLLVGPKAGLLHVGSGNLSISGYTGPGECFTTYEWSPSNPESARPFTAIREFLELEIGLDWVDSVTQGRIRDIFEASPWIPNSTSPSDLGPVVHSLTRPLLDQLVDAVAGRQVLEVVAAAPFHDKNSEAISELLRRLRPNRFRLLVQQGRTRLDKVALGRTLLHSGVDVSIEEASAADPYPDVSLHAKFILVRTTEVDVLLQGSANLSSVALCRSGSGANVELANLLVGTPSEFDSVLDALTLKVMPDGLEKFEPEEDWASTDDNELAKAGPWDVCWSRPRLTGQLRKAISPQLGVTIDGSQISVMDQSWEKEQVGWRFLLEFDEDDADQIDQAQSIELTASNGEVWTVFPYHLLPLGRLSATGNRVDLLQDVGDLDLQDKEIEELISELDRVLIIDGGSLWRLANPQWVQPDDDDPPRSAYENLDWESIGPLQQIRQYEDASNVSVLAATELGIVLSSLINRFKAEVRSGPVQPEDDDGLHNVQTPEDPEVVDDSFGDVDPAPLEYRNRTRRLWKNFIRRFVRGLSDREFVEAVGSSVVIPSYIVFNHLCRRLHATNMIDLDFLTEAQIDLWKFMWGNEDGGGYLAQLPDDERLVAKNLLRTHEDLAVTLAAIVDAWCFVWKEDLDVRPLRNVWRSLLESGDWSPEPEVLLKAAAASKNCRGDEKKLSEEIYALAAFLSDAEVHSQLASCLKVSPLDLQERRELVQRGGKSGVLNECSFLEVLSHDLDLETVQNTFTLWKALEPDQSYFRLQSPNSVAVLDLDFSDAFFHDKVTKQETALHVGTPMTSLWEVRLDELLDAA